MHSEKLPNSQYPFAQNIPGERDWQIQDLPIQNRAQAMPLRDLERKARFYDAILQTPKLLTTTAIATEYGWSPQRLNSYLQENGIQYKRDDTWVLCKPYADKGYTYPQTGPCDCNRCTRWTQKGRPFLHDLLRNDGILPLYEQAYDPVDGSLR